MRIATLIRRNIARRKTRLFLTIVAISIAFLLFGAMTALRQNFSLRATTENSTRLVVSNRIGIREPLPIRYSDEVRGVRDVTLVTYRNMVLSYFQEPLKRFAAIAVDPASYLDMYPDYVVDGRSRAGFIADRTSILVGETLARRFGWKAGDVVPFSFRPSLTDPRYQNGRFRIAGIFTGRNSGVGTGLAITHFAAFNEAKIGTKDMVDAIIVRAGCARCTDRIAATIDARFRNSGYETATMTEEAFSKALVSQIGNISLITTAVTCAGFFTVLLIAGSAMAASIRERSAEIGVLRTIGFFPGQILRMILAESIAIAIVGGIIGLVAAALLIRVIRIADPATFGRMVLTPLSAVSALILMIAFGIAVALFPAARSLRDDITIVLSRGRA